MKKNCDYRRGKSGYSNKKIVVCNARATPITDPIVTHVCDIGLGNGGSTSVSHNNFFYYCSHLKPSYHPNYVQSNRDLTRLPIRYQKSWPTVREGCLERTQLKRGKKRWGGSTSVTHNRGSTGVSHNWLREPRRAIEGHELWIPLLFSAISAPINVRFMLKTPNILMFKIPGAHWCMFKDNWLRDPRRAI